MGVPNGAWSRSEGWWWWWGMGMGVGVGALCREACTFSQRAVEKRAKAWRASLGFEIEFLGGRRLGSPLYSGLPNVSSSRIAPYRL